jgi:hypothetical protein
MGSNEPELNDYHGWAYLQLHAFDRNVGIHALYPISKAISSHFQ